MEQQLWNGLSVGALYAMIALGYTIVFGLSKTVFFALGEISTVAAFTALGILGVLGADRAAAAPTTVLLLAAAGGLLASVSTTVVSERLTVRPIASGPRTLALISSLGLSIVIQSVFRLGAGPQSFVLAHPIQDIAWEIGDVRVAATEVLLIAVLAVVFVSLEVFIRRSRYGLALLAVPQSPVGAKLVGIRSGAVTTLAFAISGATAALAGVFLALYYGVVRFDMGFVPGIKGFTVAIIGGVGSLRGAVVAGLAIGVAESLFAGYVSAAYRDTLVFALLVATLIFRPEGLFGAKA